MHSDKTGKKEWLMDVFAKHLYRFITTEELRTGFAQLDGPTQSRYRTQAQTLGDTEVFYWLLDQIDKDAFSRIYFEDDRKTGLAMLHVTNKMRSMVKELLTVRKSYKPNTR